MPRIARIVAAGYPHHITQRGNYRQKIFADDTDRRRYFLILKEG
jgi:putative transposase